MPSSLIFQNVTNSQTSDGDMLLAQITIERSLARNFRIEVLHVITRSHHCRTVRLSHAKKVNIDCFYRRLESKFDNAELLHTRFGLDTDSRGRFPSSSAVILKIDLCEFFLRDKRFLRIVGLRVGWFKRCLSWAIGCDGPHSTDQDQKGRGDVRQAVVYLKDRIKTATRVTVIPTKPMRYLRIYF